LYAAGTNNYELVIKTKDEDSAETKAAIYVEIIGTLGKTSIKLLTDKGFAKGLE